MNALPCEVLVVGGGTAGVAAAVAAGRAGAKVVLLERNGFLGGLATAAEVGTVCGLYLRESTRPEATPLAGGFLAEFAQRLQQRSGLKPLRLTDGLWVLPFSTPIFAGVADTLLRETENVTLVLHATLSDARVEGSRFAQARALAWNEPLEVRPASVVDCSGEATAAALAGAPTESGAADQVPALVFSLANLTPDFQERGWLEVRLELRRGVAEGRLPPLCERLSLIPGTEADGCTSLKLNLFPGSPAEPDWRQVSVWEREARQAVETLHQFLVKNTRSARDSRLSSVAPQLGTRSGRRIQGRAKLTDDDVLGARKSALGVARGSWPMERWGQALRPALAFFPEGDYYEIPLDALRPTTLENLLTAGRSFSATAGAMTSARVIGTALSTGWAAGTAAAFQALGRPLDEIVDTLRRQNQR